MPVSVIPFDPNPDGSCRSCRGPLDADTWLCKRCGTAHGERNRCPHCHTVARTLPHPLLLHRCSVCGKPRFAPSPVVSTVNDPATLALRTAAHAHRMSVVFRMLGYASLVLGLPGLALTTVILLILMPGAWVAGIALALALLPLILWLVVQRAGRVQRDTRERSLDAAYSQAILGLLRASATERDTAEIAQALQLPVERTERLITALNAHDQMTSRVTDDGELLFGVSAPGRLRIADPAAPVPRVPDSTEAIIDADIDGSDASADAQRRRT